MSKIAKKNIYQMNLRIPIVNKNSSHDRIDSEDRQPNLTNLNSTQDYNPVADKFEARILRRDMSKNSDMAIKSKLHLDKSLLPTRSPRKNLRNSKSTHLTN